MVFLYGLPVAFVVNTSKTKDGSLISSHMDPHHHIWKLLYANYDNWNLKSKYIYKNKIKFNLI